MEKQLKVRKNSTVEDGAVRLSTKLLEELGISAGDMIEVVNSHISKKMRVEELDWMSKKEIELNENEIKNLETKEKAYLTIRL
ncbi:MAG: hypothetical protein J7L10_00990 [Methanomicrobia archaeon]|nr:hypothetical protein [Methanomicrobia archaeon]RLF94391.1 MAG: hypothetical protein DRN50_05535 [Thermococci archaeon]RLF99355.1 MAG: hypothetical protein DRN58_05310 [Thermococci archaeon]HDN81247.1 hypothetical protein [Methanomicrobia archaeon]